MTFATFLIMHISFLKPSPQADFNSPHPLTPEGSAAGRKAPGAILLIYIFYRTIYIKILGKQSVILVFLTINPHFFYYN